MNKPPCPDILTIPFARELIAYLGGDPALIQDNWCWGYFAKAYPHLREKAEEYFASATTGDPGWAAYCMCQDCDSSREWAEKVIEHVTTGDPGWAAYCMCREHGSSREWAEKIIEHAATGDPAYAAYWMHLYCGSSREWAEKIEKKQERI